jgi:MOSC domain-containing protein YiiM
MDQLALVPGTIYENIVVDGIDVMTLQEGQQLQLGGARVSVTVPCEPCIQMERVRKGLQDALENRRGMFVRVITPGLVKVSDTVELL